MENTIKRAPALPTTRAQKANEKLIRSKRVFRGSKRYQYLYLTDEGTYEPRELRDLLDELVGAHAEAVSKQVRGMWHELPTIPALPSLTAKLDRILVNDRPGSDVIADAQRLLVGNGIHRYFLYGDHLCRVNLSGPPRIERMTQDTLTGDLLRLADWLRGREGPKGKPSYSHAKPPREVVVDLISNPPITLERLSLVTSTPIFDGAGRLLWKPGFYASSGVLVLTDAAQAPEVERRPKPEVKRHALGTLNKLLGSFPFVDEASYANALALLLTSFIRPLLHAEDLVPLFAINAPSPGTGKTYLAQSIGLATHGMLPPATTMTFGKGPGTDGEEERRKKLTSLLMEGAPVVLLDNVRGQVSSESLASIASTSIWRDRILGASRTATLEVKSTFVITGNNIKSSLELARRMVFVSLDAKRENPWQRKFKQPDLLAWTRRNRLQLVHAALVLVQAWVAAGRPLGETRLANFDRWARIMGGILHVAGVKGFLAKQNESLAAAEDEFSEVRPLIHAWFKTHGGSVVGATELLGVVSSNSLPLASLTGTTDAQRLSQMGALLKDLRNNVIDGHRVEARKNRTGAWEYWLRKT